MDFIDLKAQNRRLRDQINTAINRVMDHGRYIMGPEVQELEQKLAEYVGADHCISCGNGTDALQLALMALKIGPGDEVITSSFSFMATSEVIGLLGATPVFVDIDPETFVIDIEQAAQACTAKTKAIIPVSLYGMPVDIEALRSLVDNPRIKIIDDGAQSFGSQVNGKTNASVADIGATSFFPTKPLGCYGDGGALFTNDEVIAHELKILRIHGQNKRYYQKIIGVNSRLDTVQAAILLSKFSVFEEELSLRQQVRSDYDHNLPDDVKIPFVPQNYLHSFGQYSILTEDREKLQSYLKEFGIPTIVYYPVLLHEQEAMRSRSKVVGTLENSKYVVDRVLSLPMSPYLSAEDQSLVCEKIRMFFS